MSNPGRAIVKQIQRSAKDISDEWKRAPEDLRNVITVGAVAAGGAMALGAFGGGGAAASSSIGMSGAQMAAQGTLPAATTGLGMSGAQMASQATLPAVTSGGGGFLGSLGGGLKSAANAVAGGAGKLAGAVMGADPTTKAAMLTVGGNMLQGAMTPDPVNEIDILRERERIQNSRPAVGLTGSGSGGGFLQPAGPQTSGAYTTPRPQQNPFRLEENYAQAAPVMPAQADIGGRWNPNTQRYEGAY